MLEPRGAGDNLLRTMKTVRWGILATGRIAGVFAEGVRASRTGELAAVASRDPSPARKFAERFGIERAYGNYADLLGDDRVNAVYIATPHPMHAELAIRAAESGKHVLCEKPAGLNHAEAMAVVEAARARGVFFMEAFMYRCHPQTRLLAELVSGGRIGEPRMIQASFGFDAPFEPGSRVFAQSLGGGGILDVGCYPVSLARLLAGAAAGKAFLDPVDVSGAAHLGPESRVDEWAAATLRFPGGILAQISTGVRLRQENAVRVFGSEGSLLVPDPWMPGRDGSPCRVVVYSKGDDPPEEIPVPTDRPLYALEADAFAAGVAAGSAPWPAMSVDDTLGNMRTLDSWRTAVGLEYDSERPEGAGRNTVAGRPLARAGGTSMPYGRIAGMDKPVSRLVFGVDNQTTFPHAAVMFDDFFERGGTCFDTARIYRAGLCEKMMGSWLRERGVREEIVLLGKGAHTPNCFPGAIERELEESLERLQTDYLDLYLLHRDNPEVPVGEFVEALDELRKAGRFRAYGVSNWTMARIDEAERYAAARGLPGLCCVSNHFSLARMVEPPWPGCVAATDPGFRNWFQKNRLPLFAWSSQAQGFFAGRASRAGGSDEMILRCWGIEENFRRLDRVNTLADRRGLSPASIGLAWVLHQPFPVYPLIGCRTLAETRTSTEALTVELSPDEVTWLDTGEE